MRMCIANALSETPPLTDVYSIAIRSKEGNIIDFYAPTTMGRTTEELYNIARDITAKTSGATLEVTYKKSNYRGWYV